MEVALNPDKTSDVAKGACSLPKHEGPNENMNRNVAQDIYICAAIQVQECACAPRSGTASAGLTRLLAPARSRRQTF